MTAEFVKTALVCPGGSVKTGYLLLYAPCMHREVFLKKTFHPLSITACTHCLCEVLLIARIVHITDCPNSSRLPIDVFIKSPQHKNANTANILLAVPLETNYTKEISTL